MKIMLVVTVLTTVGLVAADSLLTLSQLLNATKIAVERCNEELNMNASVWLRDELTVLTILPQQNSSDAQWQLECDKLRECIYKDLSIGYIMFSGETPEEHEQAVRLTLESGESALARCDLDDPFVSGRIEDFDDFLEDDKADNYRLVKRLAYQESTFKGFELSCQGGPKYFAIVEKENLPFQSESHRVYHGLEI